MKILYQCDLCRRSHTEKNDAARCEVECGLIQLLCDILCDSDKPGGERWTPPPLINLKQWNDGDKRELAVRVIRAVRPAHLDPKFKEVLHGQ